MISIIEKMINDSGLTYPSCIIPFMFVSLGMYFLVFRWGLGSLVIKKPKITSREYNKRMDDIFSRNKLEILRVIGRWLLCLEYLDEQEGKAFKAFLIYNYLYLILILGCLIVWILAFLIHYLEVYCMAIMILKIKMLDGILFVSISILYYMGRFKRI